MTNTIGPTAGDYRRAAVLTLHYRRSNREGVVAIVEETNAEDRAAQLLLAVLGLHKFLITRLRTDDAIILLADWVHGMAVHEATNADVRHACLMLQAHGQDDHVAIAGEMNLATAEGRPTEAFLALLDLYEAALPELTSTAGTAWIETQVKALLFEESRPDDED
ncbi:hypothetical protein [Mycobacterium marinum]|uniref:hypothetical protein n=1 Tax=Mycobacterium marinum TaxID=1781 RepID=UPI000358AF60|nr:hypothetical protein [Mycobacterium marinum]EPQ76923.1 hypothetical protein MMMB2_1584 [Mycobacterium marinum MB2]